jgi:hypothetical protein
MSDHNHIPRSSTRSAVLKGWHSERGRKIHREKLTDATGKVTIVKSISINPGPSMKEFARLQVKTQGPFALEADAWLNEHKGGKLERTAMALRKKEKGPMMAQISAATKAARRSKKKGNNKKAETATPAA